MFSKCIWNSLASKSPDQKYLKKESYARKTSLCCLTTEDRIYRTCLAAGGNLIKYPRTTSTLAAGIVTIKTHWNSVISTTNSKYCYINIKDYYLNSLLEAFEYMRILFDILLQDIII